MDWLFRLSTLLILISWTYFFPRLSITLWIILIGHVLIKTYVLGVEGTYEGLWRAIREKN